MKVKSKLCISVSSISTTSQNNESAYVNDLPSCSDTDSSISILATDIENVERSGTTKKYKLFTGDLSDYESGNETTPVPTRVSGTSGKQNTWKEYFDIIKHTDIEKIAKCRKDIEKIAKCRLCSSQVKKKQSNTIGLKRHLKIHHVFQ